MNVELGKLPDGALVVMCDTHFPHEIRRIEYYRDQRLMMLVYNADHEGDLMHYELSDVCAHTVENSPNVIVVDHAPNRAVYGYDVPLVQVGL